MNEFGVYFLTCIKIKIDSLVMILEGMSVVAMSNKNKNPLLTWSRL